MSSGNCKSTWTPQQGQIRTAPPPTVEPEVEVVKDRQGLLDQLHAYKERFPELKSRNKISAAAPPKLRMSCTTSSNSSARTVASYDRVHGRDRWL